MSEMFAGSVLYSDTEFFLTGLVVVLKVCSCLVVTRVSGLFKTCLKV